jgi:CheY-like chemotaxis protein
MERGSDFNSSWPAAAACALIAVFTFSLTPMGQQLETTALKHVALHSNARTEPLLLARPEVLVVTRNSEDQFRVAATLVPRGYRVLVAGTAVTAQELIRRDANRIGLIVVDTELAKGEGVANLARSLAPGTKLIRLPSKHGSTEVAVLLMAAI